MNTADRDELAADIAGQGAELARLLYVVCLNVGLEATAQRIGTIENRLLDIQSQLEVEARQHDDPLPPRPFCRCETGYQCVDCEADDEQGYGVPA